LQHNRSGKAFIMVFENGRSESIPATPKIPLFSQQRRKLAGIPEKGTTYQNGNLGAHGLHKHVRRIF